MRSNRNDWAFASSASPRDSWKEECRWQSTKPGVHGIAAVDAVPGGAPRRDIGRFADRDDLAPIDCDRGVANDAAPGVHGDQPGDVGNDEVDELHGLFSLRYS